jgi:hypothetical protein
MSYTILYFLNLYLNTSLITMYFFNLHMICSITILFLKKSQVRLKTGHILRNLSVISQKNDLQSWKDSIVIYGHRWIVETAVFSCIKRTFDREYVYSVRLRNMIQEMMLKASLYNKFASF